MAEEQQILPDTDNEQEQQPADTPAKRLYDQLNKSQLYTKSYEEFQNQFNNQASIDKLYDHLNGSKLYTKSKDDFYSQFFSSYNQPRTPSIPELRELDRLSNQPTRTSSINTDPLSGSSYLQTNQEDINRNAQYQQKLDQSAAQIGTSWGIKPETVKNVIKDFPYEQNEGQIKKYSSFKENNPYYYNRLKDANDIRMTIANSGQPEAIHDANIINDLFNPKQTDTYEGLQHNIALSQEMLSKYGLGQQYSEKLKNVYAPLINVLQPGLHQQYWNSDDSKLGLSDYQYAGLETEKMFNPGLYHDDLAIIRSNRGLDQGGLPTAEGQAKRGYEYDRGVENVLYRLQNAGRNNTAQYIAQRKSEVGKSIGEMKDKYQQLINSTNDPILQKHFFDEFQNDPVVTEANQLDEGQLDLQYSVGEDRRKFPLTYNDQATRMVKDAMDGTTGFMGNVGKWFDNVLTGAGEASDNTIRFIKNTAINLVASEQTKAIQHAKDIGHQSLTELANYDPVSYTGVQSPLLISDDLKTGVQNIINNKNIPTDQREQDAINYIKDNWDKISINPKAGQQNLTWKSFAFNSANTLGQILGIADQSLLMGGLMGDAAKLKQMANAVIPMYASTQNQMYEKALQSGEEKPLLKSSIDAAIISLASLINPDYKVVKGMVGAETGVGKLIAGIDESTWNKILTTNSELLNTFKGSIGATAKQLGLANLQYGLIVPTAQYIVHKNFLNENPNLGDNILDGMKQASVSMLIPAIAHGIWGGVKANEINPMQKGALVELGRQQQENIDLLNAQVERGQITPEKAEQIKNIIKETGNILKNTEFTKTDGTPMNENEVSDIVYNQLRKNVLDGKLKNASAPQKPIIEDRIHELDKEIANLHTSDKDKQKTELNKLLSDNLPLIEKNNPSLVEYIKKAIAENEPEKVFSDIADQASETTKFEGREISTRQQTEEMFGKDLVNKSLELRNIKTKQNELQDSQRQQAGERGEITQPETEGTVKQAVPSIIPSETGAGKVQPVKIAGTEVGEHGEDTHTAQQKENGVKPTNLTPKGILQAKDLGEYIAEKGKTKAVSSTVERAIQTLNEAAKESNRLGNHIEVSHNSVLNTLDIGENDGKGRGSFDEKYYFSHPDEQIPGGEKARDFMQRMEKAYDFIKNASPDTQVIAHSKVLRALRSLEASDGKWTGNTTKEFERLHEVEKIEEDLKAYQESYDRLIASGIDINDPDLVRLKNKIENLKTQKNAEPIRSDQGRSGTERNISESGKDKSSENIQLDEKKEAINAEVKQQARPGKPSEDIDWPFIEEPGDNKITSTKNAITEEKVKEAGLIPAMKEAARSFGKVWEEAQRKIGKGEDVGKLIDKLAKKPRAVTDLENAMILYHQNIKESQLDAANKDLFEAYDKGNQDGIVENTLRRAALLDDLQKIYDVDRSIGRETARGLNARKMMADRRFSLVNMQMEERAAKGGAPLTEEEISAVDKKYNEIKEANDKYQKRISELEAENKLLKESVEAKKTGRKTSAQYKQERSDIIQRMREDLLKAAKGGQGLTASIPLAAQLQAIAPHIKDLVKSYVHQGVDKIEDITKELNGILKPIIPEIEDHHIHDLITGDFDLKAPREGEPVQEQGLRPDVKSQAKAIKLAINDPKAMKLRAEYERKKDSWTDNLKKIELDKRSKSEKIQDAFVKWERAFKLSGITTLAKLGMAAATRITMTPVEEAVGAVYSKGLPKVATLATGEAGFNVKAEARALTSAFSKGMKDSYDIMSKGKRGQSDIEAIFGKKGELPPEAISFFGQLHSAIKAPVKRAAFERSMTKRITNNMKNGVDVSDPMVQSKIAIEAYKDAQRAIFMQDNAISTAYNRAISSLEKGSAGTKLAATGMKWLIPFVKVPTNIVGEVATNAVGVPVAAVKLMKTAMTKGLENLTTEEADSIMRNLKKGSIGAFALTVGYFNPATFGGYYQQGEERKEGDLKAGQAKAFGLTIPVWLQESPIFQTMQLGATVRRLKDGMIGEKPKGIGESTWAAALGLAEHEPLVDQPARIYEAIKNPKERDYFLDELAKSTIEPAVLQNIAQFTDHSDKSRKPTTFGEHLKMGIPGLREEVPEKKEKRSTRPSHGSKRS